MRGEGYEFFSLSLGGLRLAHVVDFTSEPFETDEIVDLFAP